MSDSAFWRLHNPKQAHDVMVKAWGYAKAKMATGSKRLILEIRQETRSSQQNRLLHALFNDVSKQAEWMGKPRTPAEWKLIFVSGHSVATQQGAEVVPGLEGEFLNLRESTAQMSRDRMGSLLEYVLAWCANNDIDLREAARWQVDPETGEIAE